MRNVRFGISRASFKEPAFFAQNRPGFRKLAEKFALPWSFLHGRLKMAFVSLIIFLTQLCPLALSPSHPFIPFVSEQDAKALHDFLLFYLDFPSLSSSSRRIPGATTSMKARMVPTFNRAPTLPSCSISFWEYL